MPMPSFSNAANRLREAKWATFVFWNVIEPMLRRHHTYYRRKVMVDRFLEQKGFIMTLGIGVLFGGAAFVALRSYLPGCGLVEDPGSMEGNMRAVLAGMGIPMNNSMEFPIIQLLRAKAEIISKVHSAMDRVEVKRQREEVQRMKEELDVLRGGGGRSESGKNAAAGTSSGSAVGVS